jgi:hypothetical protein
MLLVADRGDGAGNRQAIERVRVEAVLDAFERLDQVALADRVADPQAGQRTRLGEGVHDQQVRVAIDQRNRRLAAEVDVGFIDDDTDCRCAASSCSIAGSGSRQPVGAFGLGKMMPPLAPRSRRRGCVKLSSSGTVR